MYKSWSQAIAVIELLKGCDLAMHEKEEVL